MELSGTNILPLITVVIPCFNHGRYLPDAIKSIQEQHYKNVEIIVVNDGSADDTEIVAKQFPGVIYIYQSNKGLSAARNTGIKKSNGSFLIFLDADDWLYGDSIDMNYRRLVAFPDAAFVSG